MDEFKKSPLFKIAYLIPGLLPLYHFLMAFAGAVFYDFPSKKIFVVGVTGTKGKTTTLELLNSILEAAGKKTALISSLRVKIGDKSEKNQSENSMPGRAYLQKFLKQAVLSGCQYALVEVTSQGVSFYRHRFIYWNSAILTNLAPEHIEAHGSFAKYRAAKAAFLKYVGKRGGKIFLNKDDKNTNFFISKLADYDPLLYSKNEERISRIFPAAHPVRVVADSSPPRFLLSDFNKENVAAAAAWALHAGIQEKTIEEALRNFQGVHGRMEFVQAKPFAVVVDYAHTVESLKAVYASLKNRESSSESPKLICVLGAAGGGRDKWKRPEMGKVAAQYCDKIYLTTEDPYDEDPQEIVEEILSGIGRLPSARDYILKFEKVLDRAEAIGRAISSAKSGDTVALTGKGSEAWIHLQNGRRIPWNERAVVEEALKQRQAGR